MVKNTNSNIAHLRIICIQLLHWHVSDMLSGTSLLPLQINKKVVPATSARIQKRIHMFAVCGFLVISYAHIHMHIHTHINKNIYIFPENMFIVSCDGTSS